MTSGERLSRVHCQDCGCSGIPADGVCLERLVILVIPPCSDNQSGTFNKLNSELALNVYSMFFFPYKTTTFWLERCLEAKVNRCAAKNNGTVEVVARVADMLSNYNGLEIGICIFQVPSDSVVIFQHQQASGLGTHSLQLIIHSELIDYFQMGAAVRNLGFFSGVWVRTPKPNHWIRRLRGWPV